MLLSTFVFNKAVISSRYKKDFNIKYQILKNVGRSFADSTHQLIWNKYYYMKKKLKKTSTTVYSSN